MMTKTPVAGVLWQTIHYLVGFQRLGFDPYYVEAHARTPGMLMRDAGDDSGALAARYIRDALAGFGLDRHWAYQALHDDGRVYGMTDGELRRLHSSAELIVNLHGGTEPRPEHYETGRLVYLETDPVQLQLELAEDRRETLDFLEPHVAFFTFAENYGHDGCGLPVSDRVRFQPTRQPVVTDLWLGAGGDSGTYTTVGNWRQPWRDVTFEGERYGWSKHEEFEKFLDLPATSGRPFELALASTTLEDRELLERRGWSVLPALDISTDSDAYREYIRGSRAEFTVAKDQNVRLRTGWFSDRSATYLASGRPVVTQDTGFGDVLPTGEALFPFTSTEDAAAAIEAIEADYPRARRAAFELAREHFDAVVVLRSLLDSVGISVPQRRRAGALPATLELVPLSRRPMTLPAATVDVVLTQPIPETSADRLGRRRRDVSVVVVAPKGLVYTRLCLESILLDTDDLDLELVVVDNGSTDGTREYLAALAEHDPRMRVLRNNENRGFPPAVNQGLQAASGDILVVLNNDTIVPPGSLAQLIAHLGRPEVGLVGPTTNRCGTEAEVDVTYRTYGELVTFAQRRAVDHAGAAFHVEVATLFCAGLRRDVLDRIGLLDERFEVGLFEDDDYSARVREAGLRVVCAEDAFVHHFGEASFGGLFASGRYGDIFRANKARFEEKWGVAWHPHQRRPKAWYRELVERIRETVDRELPPDATVLVVSNGDDELLELGANRRGWHFPQLQDGTHAGHHPADSTEALAHLSALRQEGAQYILFPSTGFWWLDYYGEFAAEVRAGRRALGDGETCLIFDVSAGQAGRQGLRGLSRWQSVPQDDAANVRLAESVGG
jgi:GT2 family glycosyltransferase